MTGRTPLVMGILNVTPDSFTDGGQHTTLETALTQAHKMASAGAALIDIGGESTRPGAASVSQAEELDRVMPVCEALLRGSEHHDPITIPISIDTRKAAVASATLAAGAHMINDVSAASDPGMIDVIREAGDGIPVVLMHMRGKPDTMQQSPHYDDVCGEVFGFLSGRAESVIASGIGRSRIIVDPGIGFGKRLQDNLLLLKNIDKLRNLGYPVLVGASRKTFIGQVLEADTDHRLTGSLAVAAQCYRAGVELLRVHDVAETIHLIRVLDAIDTARTDGPQ
jgi:dihydropteroate synthase